MTIVAADKDHILQALIEQIDVELETMTRLARDAADAASHPENRAEGMKDMRSTEASYVARGQAERAIETVRSRMRLSSLDLKSFPEDSSIESTALVQLLHQGKSTWYFLLPTGGGRQIPHAGEILHTITPTSPLGAALLGLGVGEQAEVPTPAEPNIYEVLALL